MSSKESTLQRTTSRSAWKIIPSSSHRAIVPTSSPPTDSHESKVEKQTVVPSPGRRKTLSTTMVMRSLLRILSIGPSLIPICGPITVPSFTPCAGRRVTGTLFGQKHGHVNFAVQFDPRLEPVMLIELATSTCSLIKEMASGTVRVALECERGGARVQLIHEPVWTMYCNGRRCGHALSRTCGESDWHVLRAVQTVTLGAGVLPTAKSGGGQLMYMRAKFERVVGSMDSEALYMLSPEGRKNGPELSIFLLRI